MEKQEMLTKQIKELSDSIRKKTRALKSDISERDAFLETTFKPVVGPLKEISKKLLAPELDNVQIMPKVQQGEIKEEEEEEEQESETESDNTFSDSIETMPETEISLGEPYTPSRLSLIGRDIRDKGLLTRKYVLKMLHSSAPKRKFHVFGARLDDEGLMIGNSKLTIDEFDNLHINDKLYAGTPGLFELIFTNDPKHYTKKDLQTFKEILILTNAHKKNYISSLPLHKNTSIKYKSVISKLFQTRTHSTPSQSGQGLKLKNVNNTNVIYYNNINKLIKRMRLLYEAKEAGHTGVDNELIALIEELRSRGYIM